MLRGGSHVHDRIYTFHENVPKIYENIIFLIYYELCIKLLILAFIVVFLGFQLPEIYQLIYHISVSLNIENIKKTFASKILVHEYLTKMYVYSSYLSTT